MRVYNVCVCVYFRDVSILDVLTGLLVNGVSFCMCVDDILLCVLCARCLCYVCFCSVGLVNMFSLGFLNWSDYCKISSDSLEAIVCMAHIAASVGELTSTLYHEAAVSLGAN